MNRRSLVKIALTVFVMLFLMPSSSAYCSQQERVDDIIGRIRTTLNSSLNASNWEAKYSLASKNIEDLRKTLEFGGKISSNPVKAYYNLLSSMLDERKAEFKAYCDAQEKLQKNRKKAAKQAINDVGMEMISRITPKPGITTPFTQARTKNAEVIKKDFARLKSIDEAIAVLEGYKKSILPSIHAIRDRKHALGPLVEQFASLSPKNFDGTYTGHLRGEGSGAITLTVSGSSVSGTVGGAHKGDGVRGNFKGTIDASGNIRTTLTGTLTDSSKYKLGTFSFSGAINGRINGAIASGNWSAKNKYGTSNGSWSASKK